MSNASKIPGARRLQYGALPYRVSSEERAEFMLVTSRETRRWIIPKGWQKRGKSPHGSAAREAFEEAGVVGRRRQATGRLILLREAPEKRKIGRVRRRVVLVNPGNRLLPIRARPGFPMLQRRWGLLMLPAWQRT
jgi:8-oxo-dGTP pyrophosphatase MutT (NUDIX family)